MNPFRQLFSSKAKNNINETEADKVIEYVKGLVNREDLIEDLVKKYDEARLLSKERQESAYIPIYIALEAFITHNKPLIVKQEFSKDGLRESIRKQFDINSLASSFRLIFLTGSEQNALLFELGAQNLAKYIITNIGLPHLNAALSNSKQERMKELIHSNAQGLSFDALDISLKNISEDELKILFKELYNTLLSEIDKSVGPQMSEKVISEIFDEVKKTYDYDIIAKFLEVLPDGILESERIRRLDRNELEVKIQARTKELDEAKKLLEQKLDLIKNQNEELAHSKEALVKSLEEAHHLEQEIKKEKEQVEQKVKERTAELQQKTDELNNTMTSLQVSYQQTENEKARLLGSINNLSLGFVMTDNNDNIIAINHISYQILKAQDEVFTSSQQLHDYLQASLNFNDYYQKCKNEKKVQKLGEVTFKNTFLRFFFNPIMINNSCIGVAILLEDISEAKLLERSKDEFFAIASHELRTPLTAIRGFTSLILDNFQEQLKGYPQMVSMINNIHDSSIRLIKIVNNFLDASKLEQGKATFVLQSFAITPIIESVVMELSPLASEKNVYVKFDKKDENLPNVYAEPEKIKQVLLNLAGNSIKFTEKGGITIWVENINTHLKIFVKDTGLGVSEKYKELLFRKFQQAGERILTRDAATGSGMGLYISKLLIEAMGGSIQIEETKLAEGSTFSFTVPIAK